ncbi:MAG: AAA family ATPase [Sphingobacteriaceae bacterium]|nr:MAG: AAA family ATPase [Sphingobacteriaceae bacterium]
MESIIGRIAERELLDKILNSGEPELVAVYGRRRVGKTFLIRRIYSKQISFEFSGIHHETLAHQLESFATALTISSSSLPLARPASWIQAFQMLITYLTPQIKKQRKVIFFDEFPWINTPKSGFLRAFENFWNTWASRQENLVVVICGSAAAWMIQKVINNRGGLHNRVSRRIRLLPFTVGESEAYLKARKINLDQYQILQLYMVMGGIPQYLKEIQPGESSIQAIDRVCFSKDGLLRDEFRNLYNSLFDNAGSHMDVVKALAKKGKGLTRKEIIETCKLTSGGGITQLLEELTESGFITPYIPFDKAVKDSIYKLTDEYSNFYMKFLENLKPGGTGSWIKFAGGSSWRSWSGTAFEGICMKHATQLKRALGIEMVYTETSVWRSKLEHGETGAQIDLLIDRQDKCINVCELKFSIGDFEISKSYALELENKLKVFRKQTGTRKTLFLTMVTTYGVKNSTSYAGLVQSEITMDALFK